jgi:hypothetical protein
MPPLIRVSKCPLWVTSCRGPLASRILRRRQEFYSGLHHLALLITRVTVRRIRGIAVLILGKGAIIVLSSGQLRIEDAGNILLEPVAGRLLGCATTRGEDTRTRRDDRYCR